MLKGKFGICNVYFAKMLNKNPYTYDVPKPIKGAVNLSLDPDNKVASVNLCGCGNKPVLNDNNGYNGTIEFSTVSVDFMVDILGYSLDSNGLLSEESNNKIVPFALLYQTEGINNPTRYLFFECTCTKQGIEASTKTDKAEAKTETLNLMIRRRFDKKIKTQTTEVTPVEVYNNWFNTVVQ